MAAQPQIRVLDRRTFCSSVASLPLAGRRTMLSLPASRQPWNLLLILSDQHRYDCVGANGNSRIHTPHLDRLAAAGARFERAYVAQPVCSPNRAALLTGLYPHSSGVWENNVPLPPASLALSELLRPRGYDCGYFGKWHLGRRNAFETIPEYPNDGRGHQHYFGEGPSRRYSADVLTEDALAFLEKKRSAPFFACVSFYPPHPPYSVPQAYRRPYASLRDEEVRTYYAMVTKVDEQIGLLLDRLQALELERRTLVVFTSEHGHYFRPRWNQHAKRLCYDTAARVPLILRMPGEVPSGLSFQGLFSAVDLTPTVLGLLGARQEGGFQGRDLSRSLKEGKQAGREYFFMENIPFPFRPEQGMERCVGDEEWKLILSTHRPPELLAYREDPEEVRNRYGEMKFSPALQRLLEALREWGRQTHDGLSLQLMERTQS